MDGDGENDCCMCYTNNKRQVIILDIRVLEYFLMVAKEENITKAAGLLHVTQPTLSRQLMQLEKELGTKLFERTNHSVILTNEGMLFRRIYSPLDWKSMKLCPCGQKSDGVFCSIKILPCRLNRNYPLIRCLRGKEAGWFPRRQGRSFNFCRDRIEIHKMDGLLLNLSILHSITSVL